MIKFNGYYTFEPFIYDNRSSETQDFFLKAYLFFEDGRLLIASKYKKNLKNISFELNDFTKANRINCYYLIEKKNEFYYLDNCLENSYKFFHKVITENKIIYRDTGEVLTFVPW